jgi:hypothetical protein
LSGDTSKPCGEINMLELIAMVAVGLLLVAFSAVAMELKLKRSMRRTLAVLESRQLVLEERLRVLKAETPYSSIGTSSARKSG